MNRLDEGGATGVGARGADWAPPQYALQLRRQIYPDTVPAFAAAELERLYSNVYSTLLRFRLFEDMTGVSTYVERGDGQLTTILLFHRHGPLVRVLNQQIALEPAAILAFAETVFDSFKGVNKIAFWAIQATLGVARADAATRDASTPDASTPDVSTPDASTPDVSTRDASTPDAFPYPFQQCYCIDEISIALPPSPQAYLARLGKSTRHNIRYYLNRLKQQAPGYAFTVYTTDQIAEQQIHAIIALSRARLASKHKRSDVDAVATARMLALCGAYGLIGVLSIDGAIAAGVIAYQVGRRYFVQVVGHDARYDTLRVGTLSYYLTIVACIERGGLECRLMGSTHEYKYNLNGVRMPLDALVLYRTRVYFLLDSVGRARSACRAVLGQGRQWLLLAERRGDRLSRWAAAGLRQLRAWKKKWH